MTLVPDGATGDYLLKLNLSVRFVSWNSTFITRAVWGAAARCCSCGV